MKKVFQTVDWAYTTNIYEVNIRQYTPEGTFQAFAKHLPRLREMGVETLWFMPVTPISIKNRKGSLGSYYACSDYTAINPEYGTLKDFKACIRKARDLGMKIMIDWVANHTGWDHVWTVSHPEYFSKDEQGNFRAPFPDWEDVIHLDYSCPELWTAMIDAMKFWVNECDLDGFRCDMAHLVPLEFWKKARTELDAVKPLLWLAETEEPTYHEAFDISYTWELLHTFEKLAKGKVEMESIDNVLYKYENGFPPDALRLLFTSNHDENSHSGSEYERMGECAKAVAMFMATWKGVPLLYSGQELPMLDKRLEFFDKDCIPWNDNIELRDFYKTLFTLRQNNPALHAAGSTTYRLDTNHNASVLAFLRKWQDREVVVLLNLSATDDLRVSIKGALTEGVYLEIFSGISMEMSEGAQFTMKRWGWLVFEK